MKKFLLLAAFFAAFVASAQEFTVKELTNTTNVPADYLNTRQGFGMDGKFYVNDKAQGVISIYNPEDGAVENTLQTGATNAWPGVTRDEAGNIIVRVDNSWPNSFMKDTVLFKIFPAGGGDPIDVEGDIFADYAAENGRSDYLGFVEGNVMEEGALWIITKNSTGVMRVPFVDGAIDEDHIALFPVSGDNIGVETFVTVHPYFAADGTRHYIVWKRNAQPVDLVMNEDENGFVGTTFTLPNKGGTNGCFPFVFGGKDLVLYTTLPNYADGWAIAEKNAAEPIVKVDYSCTDYSSTANSSQTNWLNVEVISETKAIVYQYFPRHVFRTYELTIGGDMPTYTVAGNLKDVFGEVWSTTNTACDMQMNDNNVYEWTSGEFEIAANTEIQFKVAVDHSWDVSYGPNGGSQNATVTPDKDGIYKLTVYYEPENNNNVYGELTYVGEIMGKVYILGEVNGKSWVTNDGVEMTTEDGKIYTAKDLTLLRPVNGIRPMADEVEGIKYCYFSFATKLMDAADDWEGLAPYRFGAVSDGDFRVYKNMFGQELSLTEGDHAFQLEEGTYEFTVDMENMKLTITGETLTGIEDINVNRKADNTWYNLAGQKLSGKPTAAGIYINNGKKVVIK